MFRPLLLIAALASPALANNDKPVEHRLDQLIKRFAAESRRKQEAETPAETQGRTLVAERVHRR